MPFGTACCAIEYMATAASRFDLARFGMERQSFSPRQADVLICAGRAAVQARAGHPADLAADAAAQVVHLHGRLRLVGRHLRQLRRWCRASTPSSRWTSTSPAARRGPKGSSTASGCCRRRSWVRAWPTRCSATRSWSGPIRAVPPAGASRRALGAVRQFRSPDPVRS